MDNTATSVDSMTLVEEVTVTDETTVEYRKLDQLFQSRNKTILNKKQHKNKNTEKGDSCTENSSDICLDAAIAGNTQTVVYDTTPTAEATSDQRLKWKLRSTYKEKHGNEPELTNWSGDFIGTLDYIFVSTDWDIKDAQVFPLTEQVDSIDDNDESLIQDDSINDNDTNTHNIEVKFSEITVNSTARFNEGVKHSSSSNSFTMNGRNVNLETLTVNESQPSAVWPSDHFLLSSTIEL